MNCGPPGKRLTQFIGISYSFLLHHPLLIFTAPSWSWVSVNGHIKCFHLYPEEKDDELKSVVKVLESHADPKEPKVVSHIYSGTLKLEGHSKDAKPCLWDDELEYPLRQWGSFSSRPKSQLFNTIVDKYTSKKDELEGKLASELLYATKPTQESPPEIEEGIQSIPSGGQEPPSDSNPSIAGYNPFQYEEDYNTAMDYDMAAAGMQSRVSDQVDFAEIFAEAAKGHSLRDPVSNIQVGFWAPDVSEGIESQEENLTAIKFLALAEGRQYIFAIGLVPIEQGSSRYHRIGLGIWDEIAWNCSGGKPDEGVFEIV
jgi:hypothetical protein